MPFRDPEYRRKYRREWYAKNKESEKAHVKRRKLEIRKWFQNYKRGLVCSKCIEDHPATLEFHHRFNQKKEKAIENMVDDGCAIKRILMEIKKCEIVCANCHKKLHYDKRINKI